MFRLYIHILSNLYFNYSMFVLYTATWTHWIAFHSQTMYRRSRMSCGLVLKLLVSSKRTSRSKTFISSQQIPFNENKSFPHAVFRPIYYYYRLYVGLYMHSAYKICGYRLLSMVQNIIGSNSYRIVLLFSGCARLQRFTL